MKNNRNGKHVLQSAIGFTIFAAGLILIKYLQNAGSLLRILLFIGVGAGAGVFGRNLGQLLQNLALKKDPEAASQIEIEAKDERNIIRKCRQDFLSKEAIS